MNGDVWLVVAIVIVLAAAEALVLWALLELLKDPPDWTR